MKRRQLSTNCKVEIIRLSLSKKQIAQCRLLQKEAGRCYTDMIGAHVNSRTDKWLSEADMKALFKGGYQIHSQSVQAVAEKIDAAVNSARTNREREFKATGNSETEYPSKAKAFFCVIWKRLGIKLENGNIHLSNGRGKEPLILSLPYKYKDKNISQAELVWVADTYCLNVSIDTGEESPPLLRQVKTAGVDLGEIHIAACAVEDGNALVVSGRQLRSVKQLRNKRHAYLNSKADKAQKNSRRYKKYKKLQRKASAKFERQQRDILHKASRQVVDFCVENNVAHLAIGDVRPIADGVKKGKKCNQKLSQWAHGKFVHYLSYKSREAGINIHLINEAYSSKTCSNCGHVKSSSVTGRVYSCRQCQLVVHRDGNGAANICSKQRYGEYSKVQIAKIKYLRPIKVARSRPSEAGLVALEPPVAS